ncbi:MAG TPA: DUF3105 domain-containing protein [Thermoleophilaceae bacterium]|nr:DUF3105 domain-containing protein [Thermoleophilaceae bacterium]
MSHRREQKERLRQEREERERQARAAAQRKKMVGYGAGGLLVLAVVIVAVVLLAGGSDGGGSDAQAAEVFPSGGSFPEQKVFDVKPAAAAAGCELKSVKSGAREHTSSLSDRVKYPTNPPTSGKHYQVPAEDGIYGDPPQDEELVHGMEHGRVIFWVKPSAPQDVRANIRALVEDDSYQMFLVPRKNMPYEVAATAWDADPDPNGTGELMTCTKVDDKTYDALAAFRDEHRSQGPEPIP